jgi:hypothetical protein
MKNRYSSDKEEILRRKKISIINHPETIKKYTDAYYLANKEELNKKGRDNRIDPIKHLSRLITESKNRAKEKSLDFDLDKDFIFSLYEEQDKKCSISGILFDSESNPEFRIRPWAPSIDRINSKLGYTKNNVRLVCIAVNLAINQFGDSIFDKMCTSYVEKINNES